MLSKPLILKQSCLHSSVRKLMTTTLSERANAGTHTNRIRFPSEPACTTQRESIKIFEFTLTKKQKLYLQKYLFGTPMYFQRTECVGIGLR